MIDVPSRYLNTDPDLPSCMSRKEEVKKFQMTEEMLAFGRFPNN